MRSKNTWPDASRVFVASGSAERVGPVDEFGVLTEFVSDMAILSPVQKVLERDEAEHKHGGANPKQADAITIPRLRDELGRWTTS
jgi:hypothetical protein